MFRGMRRRNHERDMWQCFKSQHQNLEASQSYAGSTGESMLHTGIKIIAIYNKETSHLVWYFPSRTSGNIDLEEWINVKKSFKQVQRTE